MQSLTLKNSKILARISQLAQEMNITETDVIEKAVDYYSENIRKKDKLMSFAGILTRQDADDILNSIQNFRINKDTEFDI